MKLEDKKEGLCERCTKLGERSTDTGKWLCRDCWQNAYYNRETTNHRAQYFGDYS